MRLLNKGFLGLLAALTLFCSGCHSVGWHAMCYHGSTQGYFATPAPTAPYQYHTHSNSEHYRQSGRVHDHGSDHGHGDDKD